MAARRLAQDELLGANDHLGLDLERFRDKQVQCGNARVSILRHEKEKHTSNE